MAEHLLIFLGEFGCALLSRGRSLHWEPFCASRLAGNNALYRLRQAGLVARPRQGGLGLELALTNDGSKRLPKICSSRFPWKKKWDGVWHLLSYDVPEQEKRYREVLRKFLRRMKMGCLHKSVYVTPHDIRPEFDDLCKGIAVHFYAYLFRTRCLPGRDDRDMAVDAWDFDRIHEAQRWFCDLCEDHLNRMETGSIARADRALLAREELAAYLTVMEDDPLLPVPLWPPDYAGEQAWKLHQRFKKTIRHLR